MKCPLKLAECKTTISKQIPELKKLKTEVDIVFKEWVKELQEEGQHTANIMLAKMNSSITELLLTIESIKDLVSTHLAESKGEPKL